MARYFKYNTRDDLLTDAASLGLELDLQEDMSTLFAPLTIGGRPVKNRLAVQPMEGCDGTLEGLPDELTVRRYQRFGDGGAAIIWGEATAISDEGRMNPRQLWLAEHTVGAIREMFAGCRAAHREANGNDDGLLIGLQLTHSGRYSYRSPQLATRDPILDSLTIDKSTGRRIDETWPLLSDDDLARIEDQYVAAARLAAKVDVDFIDLKQCHRYLLSELLAARNRPGDYGGSLENRTRLIRNVILRIRTEVPDLLIATRMNAYDGIPYQGDKASGDFTGIPRPHQLPLQTAFGTDPNDHLQEDLAEPIEVAGLLAAEGVMMINVSAGNPYSNPHVVRPAEFAPVDGYDTPEHPLVGVARQFHLARTIQAAVGNLPVIGSGYSWLQDFSMQAAAANVASGAVSLVGLGRGTLSHPDFARTLQQHGSLDRRQVCRTFSYCTNLMRTKDHPLGQYATGCPPFDKSVYGPLWKEAEPKLRASDEAANEGEA